MSDRNSGLSMLFGFVEMRGVEQKTAIRQLEMAIGFSDATFSQQENLIARGKSVDGCGPLFEGDVECGFFVQIFICQVRWR